MAGQDVEPLGRLTAVLEKRHGRWLIVQSHFSMPYAEQAAGQSSPSQWPYWGGEARGVSPAKPSSRSRRRAVSHARAAGCLLAVRGFGLAPPAVAHLLNISPTVVRESVARGEFLAKGRKINFANLVGARREHP